MGSWTADDVTLVVVVVGLRLLVPLLLPIFPLPAIIACLVIDAADQTIFQTHLSPQTWASVESGYQGYDKALDIYYLSMAYISTLRNWTNLTAVATAQFLWYYRLVGVTIFESLHDAADPSSWRWLLLVFPNTFEYFFIAYETVRLRWDPRRMSPRAVIYLAAFIWIFIKLPQEWWIHVAELDFTDFADEHSWVYPTIAVLVVGGILALWLNWKRLPAADWKLRIVADRLPAVPDIRPKLLSWSLFEKIVLITLVVIIFSEILPDTTATHLNVLVGAAFFVTVDSAYSIVVNLRRRSMLTSVYLFVGLVALNLATAEVLHLISDRFKIEHALFFALLLSVIVTWYDRYRPVLDMRRGAVAVASTDR
ncbi:hypothetical protein ACPPVT_15880 [Angustibacter sp. McL0619]|uniref:hypothetical protein n=1 Tax=Angustibacter sp. McL0619 TaxID=3415676 RepID=UPI003CEDE523